VPAAESLRDDGEDDGFIMALRLTFLPDFWLLQGNCAQVNVFGVSWNYSVAVSRTRVECAREGCLNP
jgi:hypothetical protein